MLRLLSRALDWALANLWRPVLLVAAFLAMLFTLAAASPAGALPTQTTPVSSAGSPVTAVGLISVITVSSLVTLIYTVVNFLKHCTNLGDVASRNAVVTQLIVWLAAFAILLLGAQSAIAGGIPLLPGWVLSKLDVPSLILISLSFGSAGSFLYDRTAKDTPAILPSARLRTPARAG